MLGSTILDVAVGLILVYLLLSVVASTIREVLESFVKSRAVHLERGIRAIFDDYGGAGLTSEFYRHPLVSSLYQGNYTDAARRRTGGNLPAYIPARNFAVAVLDMAVRRPVPAPYAAQQTRPALTMGALRAAVDRIDSAFVRRALLAAMDSAQGDVARVQANLEAWYDSGMDRVSGWYKRRTQWILLGIGFATAASVDVDTLRVAQHLYRTPESRAAAVRLAARIVADSARADSARRATTASGSAGGAAAAGAGTARADSAARTALAQLDTLKLPILWRGVPFQPGPIADHVLGSLIGWLLTAFAVSFGAPFWFDLLNKIMVIRSTVKPREKSPEEGSEDRQNGRAAPSAAELAAVAAAGRGGAPAPAPAEEPPEPVPPHTPHAWADDVEDGIL
jgi:hypothetical protein